MPEKIITQTESIKVADDAEWHELRAAHIGGSEAGILLGVEKYMTRYELFYQKKGILESPDIDGVRIILGQELEAGIISAAKKIYNAKIRIVRRYVRRTDIPGMGASMDAEENIPGQGWVPCEVKLVAWNIWRDQWSEEEGEIHVPLHIALQCQHYMAVTGSQKAVLYVLVAGEKIERIEVDRSEKICALLEQVITTFWKELEENEDPSPDFNTDFEAMKRVMTNVAGNEPEDMTDDAALSLLVEQYRELKAAENAAANQVTEVKARILAHVGEFQKVVTDNGKISATLKPAVPETTRTQTLKAQPARRDLRVYPTKEKK